MIFVDTSFWVAATNDRDGRHAQAIELLRAHSHDPLITTNEVRGETWTFLRRRAGHAMAVKFLDDTAASPRVQVIRASPAIEGEAEAFLRQRNDREFSWVDATSFATMRQQGATDALAFDGDFSAAGFTELRR